MKKKICQILRKEVNGMNYKKNDFYNLFFNYNYE